MKVKDCFLQLTETGVINRTNPGLQIRQAVLLVLIQFRQLSGQDGWKFLEQM